MRIIISFLVSRQHRWSLFMGSLKQKGEWTFSDGSLAVSVTLLQTLIGIFDILPRRSWPGNELRQTGIDLLRDQQPATAARSWRWEGAELAERPPLQGHKTWEKRDGGRSPMCAWALRASEPRFLWADIYFYGKKKMCLCCCCCCHCQGSTKGAVDFFFFFLINIPSWKLLKSSRFFCLVRRRDCSKVQSAVITNQVKVVWPEQFSSSAVKSEANDISLWPEKWNSNMSWLIVSLGQHNEEAWNTNGTCS